MSLNNALIAGSEPFDAIGVIFENSFSQTPAVQDAIDYNAEVDAFEFFSDIDQLTVPFFPQGGLPRVLVVNTETMEIVYKANSYDEAAIIAAAAI